MSVSPQFTEGDSVSKLIQLRASLLGVRLKWSGKAIEDIDALCLEYFHRKMLNECLWNGVRELQLMPELKELPEAIQAKIHSIILQAHAQFELRRAQQLNKPGVPFMPPPGALG